MRRFVRCIPNSRCPNTQGWYLVLKPDDLDALMKLYEGIAKFYFLKFGLDPHLKPDSDIGVLMNPIRLAAMWLTTTEKFLLAGTTLVINSCGGMVPLDSVEIVTEVESEKMYWPCENGGFEKITISRWPEASHYYLSSNLGRVFVPPKYAHYKDARLVAEMYSDKIEDKGC